MTTTTSPPAAGQARPQSSFFSRWMSWLLSIRYVQQSLVLTWKNVLVAWRNRRATVLRLFAPFVFLLLALVIQLSLDANSKRQEKIRETDTAPLLPIGPIPSCHADLYIANKACINFLFSPNSSAVVQDIIRNVRLRNTPAMPADQVLGFASRMDAELWMNANPESTLGAVHFLVDNTSTPISIKYSVQTNTTTKGFKGNYQSPVTFFTLPLTSAVAREVSRVQLAAAGGDPEALQWNPQLRPFPHPQLRSIGMVGYVLGPFIFAACMFGIVMQLGAVVGEKEVGLVTALRLMGLRQSAYWTSWVVADLLLGFLTALSIVIWGLIMQFRFFLRNDFGLLLLLFWLFTLALSSFSYFLSTFMSRSQSATYTGFAVFLIGWICQTIIVFGVPYDPETYFAPSGVGHAFFWIFALLPWAPLSKATQDLASATNSDKSPGLRWGQRESYCQYIPDAALQPSVDPTVAYVNYDCIFPISQCYLTLILQALGWLALAIYLDNILPGPNKRARPPWYFLQPSYWTRTQGARCGLSSRQQHQLLAQATAAQHATAQHATAAGEVGSQGPKQPAQLSGGRGWGIGPSQQDARLDIGSSSGGGCSGSNGSSNGVDEDVWAEEVAMQSLLQELLPVAAAVAREGARGAAGGGANGVRSQLSAAPSWPQLQSVFSRKQLQRGSSIKPDAEAGTVLVAGASPTPSTDADCQVLDPSVANKDSSSSSGWDFAGYALAVFGLKKVFKGTRGCCPPGGCCGGTKDFHALRGVWLGIKPGQLFALLGPNGAGKTTMINCLTGLLPPSGGEMLLCGESILTEGGLDRATGLIGVCPQFDVLWGELTGMEHLLVAAHVKGLPWGEVPSAASRLLSRVQLQSALGVRASAYSGGMKRRLSVAVALVGDPKVLFLDEPTTGMDPISRRAVWDVIQEAKMGRAVVLTTHSMEEADILGDRIGIVARGRLRALGNSIRLKQKFGTGYQVLVSLLDSRTAAAVAAAGGKHTPGVRQRRRSGSKPAAAAAGGSSDGSSGVQSPRGGAGNIQQQWPELSPRNVVVGQVVSQGGPLQIPASIAEDPSTPSSSSSSPAAASSSSSGSSGRRSRETPPGSPRGDYNSYSSSGGSNASTAAGPRGAVRALFAAHLDGLVPSEENRRSLQFLVPGHQQQQLVGLLQQLEAAMAAGSSGSNGGTSGGSSGSKLAAAAEVVGEEGVRALQRGVADVQLSLTSLEEVFLSIAKQAELEASAESGATVKITLPDTGKQLEVAVGQDWVEDTSVPTAAGTAAGGTRLTGGVAVASGSGVSVAVGPVLPGWSGGSGASVRTYRIKWVQDESGALAVLEVVPAVRPQQQQQQQQQVVSGSSSGSGQSAIAPVAF